MREYAREAVMPRIFWDIELPDGRHDFKLRDWDLLFTKKILTVDGHPVNFESRKLTDYRWELTGTWNNHSLKIEIELIPRLSVFLYSLSVDDGPALRGTPVTRNTRMSVLRGAVIGAAASVIVIATVGNLASHPLWEQGLLTLVFIVVAALGEYFLAREIAGRYERSMNEG